MQDFHAQMDAQFGSDAALKVEFHCYTSSGGNDVTVYSAADYDALPAETREGFIDVVSHFPDGGSATCCTDYAAQIFKALAGRVQIFGFANEDNPTSRVAREELHPGGHDFAVVDDRYIVDPWIRLVAGETGPIVFDLQHPEEAAAALDTYGPRDCWTHMFAAEQFALQQG